MNIYCEKEGAWGLLFSRTPCIIRNISKQVCRCIVNNNKAYKVENMILLLGTQPGSDALATGAEMIKNFKTKWSLDSLILRGRILDSLIRRGRITFLALYPQLYTSDAMVNLIKYTCFFFLLFLFYFLQLLGSGRGEKNTQKPLHL